MSMELLRRFKSPLTAAAASALSAAAFSRAIWSASIAAASASGMSGIVSKDEILGLRERMLVGVEGMEDPDEKEYAGYGSLNRLPVAEKGEAA
jgi:hypothetical protein